MLGDVVFIAAGVKQVPGNPLKSSVGGQSFKQLLELVELLNAGDAPRRPVVDHPHPNASTKDLFEPIEVHHVARIKLLREAGLVIGPLWF